jgi:hypothetical protein
MGQLSKFDDRPELKKLMGWLNECEIRGAGHSGYKFSRMFLLI